MMNMNMSKPVLLSILCVGIVALISLTLRVVGRSQSSSLFTSSLPHHQRRQLLSISNLFLQLARDPRTVELRQDKPIAAALRSDDGDNYEAQQHSNLFNDVNTNNELQPMSPLRICDRKAPIPHGLDMRILQKNAQCPLLSRPPQHVSILLLEGVETFGRTGNNIIEFLHALQIAKDKTDNGQEVMVGIVMGSWATQMITNMWMAIQADSDADLSIYLRVRMAWREFVEMAFCVRIFDHADGVAAQQYREVLHMNTKDLFLYRHRGPLIPYAEYQSHIIRTLWRYYNNGHGGINIRREEVGNMCSVLDEIFGEHKNAQKYSVIHSRSLEGEAGIFLLNRIAENSGSDPRAALDMRPEYIMAILRPLNMLNHPILFITDNQRPEILEKLLANPNIGPNMILIPEEASWVGGDIMAAVMADVFIGNPASTFSGFIAKSRAALGYETTYMFRRRQPDGTWVDVCDHRCIFNGHIMNAMA